MAPHHVHRCIFIVGCIFFSSYVSGAELKKAGGGNGVQVDVPAAVVKVYLLFIAFTCDTIHVTPLNTVAIPLL